MLFGKVSLWASVLRTVIALNIALATATQLRVIGGWSDDAGDYPYVVRLETDRSRMMDHDFHVICSGTLLTSKWVLTAAHCVYANDVTLKFVRYGNVTVPRKDANISQILKEIVHPKFYFNDLQCSTMYDIALLLIETIDMKTTGKLSSVNFMTLIGKKVTMAGYGSTTINTTNAELLKIEKRPLQIGEGFIFKTMHTKFKRRTLVVAPKCSTPIHGVHYGDSGGPLLVNGKVVGISSTTDMVFVRKFGMVRVIQYFTPVSPSLNWIDDIIHKEDLKQ